MSGIDYEGLLQRAFREVILKEALEIAASPEGLPGKHHFFITFRTKLMGVGMPEELRETYPEDMTIALADTYWNLDVGDTKFSVRLTFNGVPADLMIPYGAVTSFRDPVAGFHFDLTPTLEPLRPLVEAAPEAPAETPEDSEDSGTADVVSLDQFRRK